MSMAYNVRGWRSARHGRSSQLDPPLPVNYKKAPRNIKKRIVASPKLYAVDPLLQIVLSVLF